MRIPPLRSNDGISVEPAASARALRRTLAWTYLASCVALGACGGGSPATSHEGGAAQSDGGRRTADGSVRSDGGTHRADGGTGDANAEVSTQPIDGAADVGAPSIDIAPGFTIASTVSYPTIALRGYGTVSAQELVLAGGAGALSVLAIAGEDSAHAELALAKYLSDLASLGGTASASLGSSPATRVPGQGTIVAFVSGSALFVVAGAVDADVTTQLAAMKGPRTYAPTVTVPMFLDRWDKYGFNFYYGPWSSPDPSYDYTSDFDYAQAHGGTGFAIWMSASALPDAEGETAASETSWAIQSAEKRGLPIILNNAEEYTLPVWLISQYRGSGSLLQPVPGFSGNECGSRMGSNFGECLHGWGGGPVESELLGLLQHAVREYAPAPNVISILEPHGELSKGGLDVLVNYGPAADASLQAFLMARYASVQAVDTAWYGGSGHLQSWSDVHAPDIASFAGHDTTAFDITGPWRVSLGTTATGTTAPAWSATSFDDAAWTLVPNDDTRLTLPSGAAAFRTQFTPTGFAASGPTWLYVWPLGSNCAANPRAFLNGVELNAAAAIPGPGSPAFAPRVWSAFDVNQLGSGVQTLALSLPACSSGYVLGYRTYVSKTAPALFPHLSPTEDQRWVDFSDWHAATRASSVGEGMDMIRQVDRDKPIELMAPNVYMDLDKANAQDFGGTFHDTGFMGVFWIDALPAEMRSAGLPFSAEDSSPASDVAGFKALFGHWLTEGVNGVNYFSHIGDVIWSPTIKAAYEAWQPMLSTIGKYHVAHAEVAQLFSPRTVRMMSLPWGGDANSDLNGGASSSWQLGESLEDEYDVDAVIEADFARGNADPYRVIIDGNTSFMDDATVLAIGNWIKAGGTFVTFMQTGRNSPAGGDTWPIAQLTGYSVKSVDGASFSAWNIATSCPAIGSCVPGSALSEVSGQTLLSPGWAGTVATGLHLVNAGQGAEDVLKWADGTVAVGVRPLGAGRVVTLGASFVTSEGWRGNPAATTRMIKQLLVGANVAAVPGHVGGSAGISDGGAADAGGAPTVDFSGANHFRHFVSNNGLYDVWLLYWDGGPTGTAAADVSLIVEPPGATAATLPTSAVDRLTGDSLPLSGHGTYASLGAIHLEPNDIRMFLTARNQIAQAPGAWFALQRGYWQGTKAPSTTPYPASSHRHTVDLSTAYPMGEGATGWSQSFTVPTTWTGGTKELWVSDWKDPDFIGQGTVTLDGTNVWGPSTSGARAIDLTASLTPGSTHSFAVSVQPGTATVSGVRAEAWVSFLPSSAATLSLAGTWTPSSDGLSFAGSFTLPGPWATGASLTGPVAAAMRTVTVPASWSGSDVVLAVQSQVGLGDVIVNGHWVHTASGWSSTQAVVRMNVTSFVTPGAVNTFVLYPFAAGASTCKVTSCVSTVELESYPTGGLYP